MGGFRGNDIEGCEAVIAAKAESSRQTMHYENLRTVRN